MKSGSERCPYARPFADDFDDCPAYQPVQYVPLDLTHTPMRAVWTCGHLESARGEHGGYFPRCRLGDLEGRLAWVSSIAADRLQAWQEIAREFGVALTEPMATLFSAKSRQVELMARPGPELRAADTELRAAVDAFLAADFALMDARAAQLELIGFPVEATKIVTKAGMEALVRRPGLAAGWEPPAELMEPFPVETREFLRGLFAGPTAGEELP